MCISKEISSENKDMVNTYYYRDRNEKQESLYFLCLLLNLVNFYDHKSSANIIKGILCSSQYNFRNLGYHGFPILKTTESDTDSAWIQNPILARPDLTGPMRST